MVISLFALLTPKKVISLEELERQEREFLATHYQGSSTRGYYNENESAEYQLFNKIRRYYGIPNLRITTLEDYCSPSAIKSALERLGR